jgi:hypothetical protein
MIRSSMVLLSIWPNTFEIIDCLVNSFKVLLTLQENFDKRDKKKHR